MALDDAAYKKRLYYARKELGLCVKCAMTLSNEEKGKYITCAACREKQMKNAAWKKAYRQKYREECRAMIERISIAVQRMIEPDELTVKSNGIPAGHRCWKCEWGSFCGDRFFCPIYGCCVRRGERIDAFDAV